MTTQTTTPTPVDLTRDMLLTVFCCAYSALLRAEARAIATKGNSVEDIVGLHNIFEDARNKVVIDYLPCRTAAPKVIEATLDMESTRRSSEKPSTWRANEQT